MQTRAPLSVFSYCFIKSKSNLPSEDIVALLRIATAFSLFLLFHSLWEKMKSVVVGAFSGFQSFLIVSHKDSLVINPDQVECIKLSVFSYCFSTYTFLSPSVNLRTSTRLSVFSYCFEGWKPSSMMNIPVIGDVIFQSFLIVSM